MYRYCEKRDEGMNPVHSEGQNVNREYPYRQEEPIFNIFSS